MARASPQATLCRYLMAGGLQAEPDGAWAAGLVDPTADHLALARLAGRHLVTPALAEAIAATPGLLRRLPEEFAAYLQLIRRENRRRNRALHRQLGEIVGCLNAIEIEPVLLKGSIRLVDGLYPHRGWRFMRDLDVLLPQRRVNDAVRALAAAGYASHAPEGWPSDHQHLPPLARDGDPAVLELHSRLLPRLREVCDAEVVLAGSRPIAVDGTRARLPGIADQLSHLIAHDRFDAELCHAGRFLLRSALETALLCRDGEAVDETLRRFARAGIQHWARAHLQQTARLFPGLVPALPSAVRGVSPGERWRTTVARLDEQDGLRRVYWFARHRFADLAHSAAARERLARHVRSRTFYGRWARRLGEVWAGG